MKERKLTDKEERIAQSLPDAEFKKRYGKDWKSVKIATATKMAKMKEAAIRKFIKEQIKTLAEAEVKGDIVNLHYKIDVKVITDLIHELLLSILNLLIHGLVLLKKTYLYLG